MKKIAIILLPLAILGTFVIVSCKKDGATSLLQIKLTDNPIGLREVNVDIQQVRVKFSDDTLANNGWVDLATNARIYNLLGLQNGVDTILATGSLPQNIVKEIRFVLGTNNTVVDSLGMSHPLTIPSGSESGLKIKISKSLNATIETVVIDFDAALSIKQEASGYKLRPVLKIK